MRPGRGASGFDLGLGMCCVEWAARSEKDGAGEGRELEGFFEEEDWERVGLVVS